MLDLFRNLFSPPRDMILLLLAAWLGLTLAEKRAKRYGVGIEHLNNIAFYSLLGLILGGRVFFILQNMSAFLKSPLGIFSINPDLFEPTGGIAVAIIVGLVYGQSHNLKLWDTLDALAPIFAALAAGIGLAHLAAGSAFGKETSLPIGIELWNATRHPTQIYETIAALLTFGLTELRLASLPRGGKFLLFGALTAFWQIPLQTFRAEHTLIFNGLILEQALAWSALAVLLALLEWRIQTEQHG